MTATPSPSFPALWLGDDRGKKVPWIKGFPRGKRRNPYAGPFLPARPIADVCTENAKTLAEEAEEAAERVLPVAVAIRHAQRLARHPRRIARTLDRHVRHP